MGEVVAFTGNTIIDQPPEVVLEQAKGWGMTECVVIGFDEAGAVVFGGSFSDAGKMLILCAAAQRQILDTVIPP